MMSERNADAQRFLELLWLPGDTREVRIPRHDRSGNTASGYFADPDAMAEAIRVWDGRANVYVTLNPVSPALLARYDNRIEPRAHQTTADVDVARRDWLLVDADPVRPSGISSTDPELEAAASVLNEAVAYLGGEGWPEPVMAVSGNGYHALYRIALPNDAESSALVSGVLRSLADRFNTEVAKIDVGVANAARITALIGTLKVKGDPQPDRPHRRSSLVSVPESVLTVPTACLQAVAAQGPSTTQRAPTAGRSAAGPQGWVARLLDAAGIAYRKQPPDVASIVWCNLQRCPIHFDGQPWTCGVGEAPDGRATAHCFHDRGAGMGWSEFKVALGLEGCSGRPEAYPDSPAKDSWPEPLDSAAWVGLAGEIVRAIEPYSEADPVALLVHVLIGAGALVGPSCHAIAGDAPHPARFFGVLVGDTSRGRKGSAQHPVERLLALADSSFARSVEGLSSGEGLIWAVRDPILKMEQVGKGADRHPEVIVVDEGVTDKRLLVVETEFSAPLRIAQRDGNTLTAVLRRAWDGRELRTLTKTSPAVATGTHICVVGHITRGELLRCLDRTDLGNGFANRFLWMLVRRSKLLPEGELVPEQLLVALAERLARVQEWASAERRLRRDDEARAIWQSVYGRLTDGHPGLLGAVTSRAEAQVLRLSALYAVLDMSEVIEAEHLMAALAIWRYAEASAEAIFGDAVGDPIADTILTALRRKGELSRTDIADLLGRHPDRHRIEAALTSLSDARLAVRTVNRETGGRPQEVWRPLFSHISLNAQAGSIQ